MKLVILLALVLPFVVAEPATDCLDHCDDPKFRGFGYEPTKKCGCCPFPCECNCRFFELEKPPCEALLDMVFIMDSSGSIGSNWGIAKQFVIDIARSLTKIGTDQRMAMVSFSSNATLEWNLMDSESDDAASLEKAINSLQLQGSFTNTVEAMEVAINQILGSKQDDPRKPNIVVVLTDGRANFFLKELPIVAKELQSLAEVIAIGVTSLVDDNELETIATSKVFSVNDFSALKEIIRGLTKEICPDPILDEVCYCCCSPEQFFAGGGSISHPFLKLDSCTASS